MRINTARAEPKEFASDRDGMPEGKKVDKRLKSALEQTERHEDPAQKSRERDKNRGNRACLSLVFAETPDQNADTGIKNRRRQEIEHIQKQQSAPRKPEAKRRRKKQDRLRQNDR